MVNVQSKDVAIHPNDIRITLIDLVNARQVYISKLMELIQKENASAEIEQSQFQKEKHYSLVKTLKGEIEEFLRKNEMTQKEITESKLRRLK